MTETSTLFSGVLMVMLRRPRQLSQKWSICATELPQYSIAVAQLEVFLLCVRLVASARAADPCDNNKEHARQGWPV